MCGLLTAPPTKGCQPSTGRALCKYHGPAKFAHLLTNHQLSVHKACPESPKPSYHQALSGKKVTQCLQSDLSWPSELVLGTMPPLSLEKETREIGEA